MHTTPRLLLTTALTLIAFIALSAAATTADAASFSVTPGGAITAVSQGLLVFSSSIGRLSCRVTLRGRLTTGLLPKVAGTEFGQITEGTTAEPGGVRACNAEGEYNLLVEPASAWRLNYNSILGTLPENVTGILINVEPYNFLFRGFGIECLYEAKPQGVLLEVERASPALYYSGLLRLLPVRIAKHSGSVLCPAGEVRGSFELRPHQTIKRL